MRGTKPFGTQNYDNLKIAVAKICGDGKRERTRAFTELVSHYLFKDRFGRPGKGNDKGKVEGLVKYARANFMTPIPIAPSYEALNGMLSERCLARQSDRAGRHAETIGERLADIVADGAGALAAGRHRARVGIGQGDLLVGHYLDLPSHLLEETASAAAAPQSSP